MMIERLDEIGKPAGVITVRSGNADAEQGTNPSIQFLDEMLAQPNRALWGNMQRQAGKRPECLTVALSTPSTKGMTVTAYTEWEKAMRIEERLVGGRPNRGNGRICPC